ncbi:MAG: hypothetical protein NC311_17075 [Muribaculaceae bacterium]|nr:hypothetical protein [Muribaculaceae bacterium]
MKKQFFWLGAAAALFTMASCSSSEDGPSAPTGISDGEARYLSVSIVNNGAGTRGEGDISNGDPAAPADGTGDNAQATYEEGHAGENKVSAVRFYFFDNDGNAAKVKADGTNYFDLTPDPVTSTGTMPNVEKVVDAVVVINTKQGDKLPSQVVAVINPAQVDGLKNGAAVKDIASVNALRGVMENYVPSQVSTETGYFVMSNATYSDNGEVYATAIESINLQKSKDLAEANPVTIYVERTMAKVRTYLVSRLA